MDLSRVDQSSSHCIEGPDVVHARSQEEDLRASSERCIGERFGIELVARQSFPQRNEEQEMAHLLMSIKCDLPKETEGCRIYNSRVHVMIGSGESDRVLHVTERDLEKKR